MREGLGGGAEHRTAGARLRGSRLGAEARQGAGEADPVTEEISATHAGLGSCRDLEKRGELRARGGTAQLPRTHFPVREGAAQRNEEDGAGWAPRCGLLAHISLVEDSRSSGRGPGAAGGVQKTADRDCGAGVSWIWTEEQRDGIESRYFRL